MRRRYDKQGILALYPQAFFDLFYEAPEPPRNITIGECEIVTVRGPLDHHAEGWCDSYEAIVDRCTAACASSAHTIVLKLDTPGGELLGCFDAARTIRARAAAAGKRLIAYVDGCACSAGYAFASACEAIVLSDTAFVGSIGILLTRIDLTARDSAMGVRYAFAASGKRKVDGNPHALLSEAELAQMQAQSNSLAELFFELVASLRGIDVAALAALEAGVFHGAAAVAVGLADRVQTFDEMLAAIASGGVTMADDKKEGDKGGASPFDAAREALEKASDGDDPNAQRAKRALEILTKADEAGDEKKEDDDDDDDKPAAAAAQATVPSVSAEAAGDLAKSIVALSKDVASLKAERETLQRTQLLASRPDLPKDLVTHLQTMPFADAKAIVDRLPQPEPAPAPKPAATANVQATRGAGQGGDPTPTPSPATAELDKAFGLLKPAGGIRREGSSMIFDVPRGDLNSKPAAAPAKGSAP